MADAVDIVFWPVALDFKEKDVAAMPDGSILASFINGALNRAERRRELIELTISKPANQLSLESAAPGFAQLSARTRPAQRPPASANRCSARRTR